MKYNTAKYGAGRIKDAAFIREMIDEGFTQAELADCLDLSQARVSHLHRFNLSVVEAVKQAVIEGLINLSTAEEIARAVPERQPDLIGIAQAAKTTGLNPRKVVRTVRLAWERPESGAA